MIESHRHSYHLVDPSPLPISGSLGALATTVGGVMYMHSFQGVQHFSVWASYLSYILCSYGGAMFYVNPHRKDIIPVVQLGFRYGFILFIVSEVMFRFAFFLASSHSLALAVEIGSIWLPKGIGVLDSWEIVYIFSDLVIYLRSNMQVLKVIH